MIDLTEAQRAKAVETERYYAKVHRAVDAERAAKVEAVKAHDAEYQVAGMPALHRTDVTASDRTMARIRSRKADEALAAAQKRVRDLDADPKRKEYQRELVERTERVKASFDRTGERLDREAAMREGRRNANANAVPNRGHAERHASPSHHVGPCDEACRAGRRPHEHRIERMNLPRREKRGFPAGYPFPTRGEIARERR